jgi:hypothetical protein
MPYGKGSEAEIEQRQRAAKKHGAYALKERGENSLEPSGRTRLIELREIVQEREGIMSVLKEKAADGVLLFELVQSYVASEVKKGIPITEIPAVKYLPAYFNSMERALKDLICLMPEETSANAELQRIQKVIDDHDKDIE